MKKSLVILIGMHFLYAPVSYGSSVTRSAQAQDDDGEFVDVLRPVRTAYTRYANLETSAQQREFLADTTNALETPKWIAHELKHLQEKQNEPFFSRDELERDAQIIIRALLDKKAEKTIAQNEAIQAYRRFEGELERIKRELSAIQTEQKRFEAIHSAEAECLNEISSNIDKEIVITQKSAHYKSQTPLRPIREESLESLYERKLLSQELQSKVAERIKICKDQLALKTDFLKAIREALEKEREQDRKCAEVIAQINEVIALIGDNIDKAASPELLTQSCNDLKKLTARYNFEEREEDFVDNALKPPQNQGINCVIV